MGLLFELPIHRIRAESLQLTRDNAWQEFLRTVSVLRVAQEAMDDAHRRFIAADKDLERVNGC